MHGRWVGQHPEPSIWVLGESHTNGFLSGQHLLHLLDLTFHQPVENMKLLIAGEAAFLTSNCVDRSVGLVVFYDLFHLQRLLFEGINRDLALQRDVQPLVSHILWRQGTLRTLVLFFHFFDLWVLLVLSRLLLVILNLWPFFFLFNLSVVDFLLV